MLAVQKCRKEKSVRSSKNVGSTKVLEAQKCWEDKIVGSAKMLGVQNCWENKNVGRSKLLGVQKCWESYPIVTCAFFVKLKGWTKLMEDQTDAGLTFVLQQVAQV